jgi:cysteinyl-tRNA synthetase
MKLYDTKTKQKEEIKGKEIKLYVCGPTVYDRAHIGNLRTYINVDALKRSLEYFGLNVKHAMNVTDIEDKIINRSRESGIEYRELTREHESMFWRDLEELNIKKPNFTPHATDAEVISEMIKIIEKLIKAGYAYKADDGSIYFSVNKFKKYGELCHLDKNGIKAGSRISCDEYDKENPQDFALWKAAKEGEPSWGGPLGVEGRPGWHIECSAMSMLYLGETIDIHAGGVDLVFPHHENEIAQSEAYTGKQFVKHWFHAEHLLVDGKKMSKSLGNLFTLDDLEKKFGAEPLAFRLLCLQSHYRDKLNFTEKSIRDAQNTLNNLRNFVSRVSQTNGKNDATQLVQNAKNNFNIALKDDLNTPKAIAVVFNFITEINKANAANKIQVLGLLKEFDRVLGLNLSPEEANVRVKTLFAKYLRARKEKNWEKSDNLREKIEELGWLTEDLKCESILRRK